MKKWMRWDVAPLPYNPLIPPLYAVRTPRIHKTYLLRGVPYIMYFFLQKDELKAPHTQAKVLWNFNTKHFFIDASQNSSVSLLARLWHKTLKVNCSQSNLAEERWGRQIPQVVPRLAFFSILLCSQMRKF